MRFNLADYETVEKRIRRFYDLHPEGSIITDNLTTEADRQRGEWVVKATIYLSDGSNANGIAKATGMAFERDGGNGPNATSALENCETSAIGRALANMNLSGNKRASREEMEKVARAEQAAQPAINWREKYQAVTNLDEARALYAEAVANGAPTDVIDSIKTLGEKLK